MARKSVKSIRKGSIDAQIRKKLGLTQAELAAIFGLSRASISLAELDERKLHSVTSTVFTNMFVQFHELETGKLAGHRSLETRVILNEAYQQKLPEMNAAEKYRRVKLKALAKEMAAMKEMARDAENAIIVYSGCIQQLHENDSTNDKTRKIIAGLQLFKQKAYSRLLTCWEPRQAKLQARIEALAGEARALRRFRLSIEREHNPLKKAKYQASSH
jgi:transcriptional regulator with XRE-family HTH domain